MKLNEYYTPENFRGRNPYFVQLWWCVQSTFFALSPQFCYKWRAILLRIFGAKIGKGVLIRPSVKIVYPWKLSIGDYSWVGDNVVLYTLGPIEIGNNSVISQGSYLCTGSHNYDKETFDIYAKPIVIGDSCWLATDVFVAPGIKIGNECVVGARSSVFNSLPGHSICLGTPAVKIRDRV